MISLAGQEPVQRVANDLRERILGGELAAGEPLRRVELAATYGVTVQDVARALRILTDEGLVVGRSGQPHEVSGGAVMTLGAMRRLLTEAGELLARFESGGRRPGGAALESWRSRARTAGADV